MASSFLYNFIFLVQDAGTSAPTLQKLNILKDAKASYVQMFWSEYSDVFDQNILI